MKETWKIFISYTLVLFFVLLANSAFSQIEVKQFNAGWNNANDIGWVQKLSDCRTIERLLIWLEARDKTKCLKKLKDMFKRIILIKLPAVVDADLICIRNNGY